MTIEQLVDDFYSLAPKYRTKKRLVKFIKKYIELTQQNHE